MFNAACAMPTEVRPTIGRAFSNSTSVFFSPVPAWIIMLPAGTRTLSKNSCAVEVLLSPSLSMLRLS